MKRILHNQLIGNLKAVIDDNVVALCQIEKAGKR
jgi:hypothetical protein